jgi:hypothetical protein
MTHQELCALAVKWLQRAPGREGPACQVAFSESRCLWNGEIPDAIGFRTVADDRASVVVEVKVSRADFLVDRAKPHRQSSEQGMGMYRYYMAPEGLIDAAELPARWGLIVVSSKGAMRVVAGHVLTRRAERGQWRHERAVEMEWLLLATMLSRVGDIERLHAELKRVNNEKQRLARQCDAYAARERQRNVAAFENAGEPPSMPAKARAKQAA